jgi:membrane fusion protein, multidrug efflux system
MNEGGSSRKPGTAPREASRRLCRRTWLTLIGLPLAAMALAGCGRPPAAGMAMGGMGGPGEIPEVIVGKPVVKTVTDYEDFTGHTEAVTSVEIRARVSGYLIEGLKDSGPNKEGTEVKKGELLFEIDPRSYEADKSRAEASLAQSQARLDRLSKDIKRAEELLPTRSISQGDYDQILGDYREAQAAVKTSQAALRLAELNLDWTKVRAPCDGRVSKQLIDPGNMVQIDQTPLTTIVTLDPIYAYFDIDERTVLELRRLVIAERGALRTAREANIKVFLGLADEQGYPHEGKLDFADNRIDPMTGTLRVRGVFSNDKRILSPGMFARIRLPIGEPHPAVLVPEAALGSDQGERYIDVVNDKNVVEYRKVAVGALQDGGLREIKSGLTADERIVLEGLQRVNPGSEVKPRPPAAKKSGASSPAG